MTRYRAHVHLSRKGQAWNLTGGHSGPGLDHGGPDLGHGGPDLGHGGPDLGLAAPSIFNRPTLIFMSLLKI